MVVQAYSPLVRGQRFGRENGLGEVARQRRKTEAQVLVRWSLQMVCWVSASLGDYRLIVVLNLGFRPPPQIRHTSSYRRERQCIRFRAFGRRHGDSHHR